MKPWHAAAIVTGVAAATQVLLLAVDSQSGAGEELPSSSEVAATAASLSLVFGAFWLLFSVLRAKRDRRDRGH